MTRSGVLADHQIEAMISDGGISASADITPGQIQPASLDLRLGDVAYRVRASFLAGRQRSVKDRLRDFQMHSIDLTNGAVLEKGCVYVVPLMEGLSLPNGMTAAASAKSSIGRLDLLTRIITDHGVEFDRVPEGDRGPLYGEICPRSFSVVAQTGQMLNQIIFRQGKTLMSDDALRALHAETPIVSGDPIISDGLGFSVDLRPTKGNLVGYRAKPHTGVVDLSKLNHYDPAAFWEPVHTDDGWIILDPGAFYILVSREAIVIPPMQAAEMAYATGPCMCHDALRMPFTAGHVCEAVKRLYTQPGGSAAAPVTKAVKAGRPKPVMPRKAAGPRPSQIAKNQRIDLTSQRNRSIIEIEIGGGPK